MPCPGTDCPAPNESIALANQLNVNALLEGDPNAVVMYRLLFLAREAFASGRFLCEVDKVREEKKAGGKGLADEMFELGLALSKDALAVARNIRKTCG